MTRSRKPRATLSPVFVPPADHWPVTGVYQLHIRVSVELRVTVGRLGRLTFPAGLYVYTGRATRTLPARVLRHVRGARRRHWHVDYLLARPNVHIERVELASDDPVEECRANQAIGRTGRCLTSRFGASDCRAGCPTHLWRIE